MTNHYLDTRQSAAYLGLSPKTLEAYRGKGQGPRWCRLGGKSIRYAVADLDAFARPGVA